METVKKQVLLQVDIILQDSKANGAGMDFIETSFYRNTRDRFSNSNNFYDCNFRDVNMTCKRDGIREDLRDYDPRKYFGKSENKLNLDKHLLDVIQENISKI